MKEDGRRMLVIVSMDVAGSSLLVVDTLYLPPSPTEIHAVLNTLQPLDLV